MAIVVFVAAGLAGFAILPKPATAAPTTVPFGFTGATQTFTVPAGICLVQVAAEGAAGGSGITGTGTAAGPAASAAGSASRSRSSRARCSR